jgi:hypothetical protein
MTLSGARAGRTDRLDEGDGNNTAWGRALATGRGGLFMNRPGSIVSADAVRAIIGRIAPAPRRTCSEMAIAVHGAESGT